MREYTKKTGHTIDGSVVEVIENNFGPVEVEDNGCYSVSSPDIPVLEDVFIEVRDDYILMNIEEVSVEDADLSYVPEAIRSKNIVLEDLTGKTVSDRKQEIREEVLPDKEWVPFGSSEI